MTQNPINELAKESSMTLSTENIKLACEKSVGKTDFTEATETANRLYQ